MVQPLTYKLKFSQSHQVILDDPENFHIINSAENARAECSIRRNITEHQVRLCQEQLLVICEDLVKVSRDGNISETDEGIRRLGDAFLKWQAL